MTNPALSRLQIHHVRNLQRVELEGLRQVNVLYGRNGSGKTSVLEAIYLLGMARTFRGSVKSLISHGCEHSTVFGEIQPGRLPLGIQRTRSGDVRLKLGGQAVRTVAAMAEQLPLQVISADSFDLLTGAPAARRQYLDWGVFHVEQRFYGQWQRFQRGIKQRNKLLRRGKLGADELAVWTRELAGYGEAITRYRLAYFDLLERRFQAIMTTLAPTVRGLELRFRQGWDKHSSFAQALAASEASDREQGYTHVGPQRADIRVLVDGHLAAETLSRGQQKLVVCGLKLAQGQLLSDRGGARCTYLVDDLPSELDTQHCQLVCEELAQMQAQVFITCVHRGDLESVWPRVDGDEFALFHVEQGEVTREPMRGASL